MAVLSNNDGCIIARSNEVKALGVPMGMPFFQAKALLKKHRVVTVSSNYALYADMSNRVMNVVSRFTPEVEIYSIDEAFLDLTGFQLATLSGYARGIAQQVKQWTGIPVGIGIGPTRVLAKIANRIVKKQKIPGGVFDIGGAENLEGILESVEVGDIWGVGRKWGQRLNAVNIFNARQLRDADMTRIRKQFSVVMQRIVLEMRGVPCLEFEDIKPKKQIIASRSFGRRVTHQQELAEALAMHTSNAAERLRKQNSLAGSIHVSIRTGRHNPRKPYYAPACTVSLPAPTADTRKLIAAALKGLQ